MPSLPSSTSNSLSRPNGIKSRTSSAASSPTRYRHGVLALTLALTAVSYLDRVCISITGPDIKRDLHLNDAQLGNIYSAFILAYALCEVPAGWLADRFGPRLMLTRVVIWWSLMTAATGWVGGFLSLFVVRALFGMGEAGTFPGLSRAYARWLPESIHGHVFGLAVMMGLLGGAVAQKLTAELLKVMSWRHIFPLYSMVGVIWAAAWYGWFRDDPHHHPSVNESELRLIGCHSPIPHAGVPWKNLIRNRNLLALGCMYFGAIYGWYFFLTWLPTYLLENRGFDMQHVGWLSALPLLCMAAGVAAGGWLSDVLTRRWGARAGRRTPGLLGLPLGSAAMVGAILTKNPVNAALLIAVGGGLAAMGVAPAWAVCLEIGRRHAGVVTGAMNTFGNLGGALSPLVVGQCVHRWHSWNAPLISVAAFYLVSAAFWLVIDPTKPIPDAPPTYS